MTKFSIKKIKSIGQPPEVMNRRVAEHWSGPMYMRKISPYLTKILLALNLSPTFVTWLMVFSGWIAAGSLLIPGRNGVILALIFAQIQMLFDCSDGEMARILKRFNPAGIFIDRFGHYSTEALIAIAFGIRVATQNDSSGLEIIYGLVLALLITFNKVFNDMVHVARSFANLNKLSEDKKVAVPRNKVLAFVRSLFNFFPIHRIFHSMELSFIIFISWFFTIEDQMLLIITFAAAITVVGHLVAILSSSRLRG